MSKELKRWRATKGTVKGTVVSLMAVIVAAVASNVLGEKGSSQDETVFSLGRYSLKKNKKK